MKPIYIFASRLRAFWVLMPMSAVLLLALKYNGASNHWVKLYPLIIFTVGAIIFTFVYLFRFIAISYSEIKYIGRFTSRDSATVNEGKTLVVELCEKGRVSVRLYGNEGYNPDIKWLTNEDGEVQDICLFRGTAYGGGRIAEAILAHFGTDNSDIDAITYGEEEFYKAYENTSVSALIENSHKVIKIRFNKTV